MLTAKIMPRKEYTGVSIKDELTEEVKKFIDDHPSLGYRSITQFIEAAVREELDELRHKYPEPPRFEHLNMSADGVKIIDRQKGRLAEIYIRRNGIKCDICETSNCEHIQFALTVPKIQKIILERKKDGWNLPDI